MSNINPLNQAAGQMDIYLIDQILNGRYQPGDCILDCGCGSGRNLHWFAANDFNIYGVDTNTHAIDNVRINYPRVPEKHFIHAGAENIPFADAHFEHILSIAVLHFAPDTSIFQKMFAEMVRVLKPGGTIFLRMAADTGIKDKINPLGDGVYDLPDGTRRFLLTKELLAAEMITHHLSFAAPFKTVVVADQRAMCVAVLKK